nr:hypothetical protein [Kofleriaceae bacterium]
MYRFGALIVVGAVLTACAASCSKSASSQGEPNSPPSRGASDVAKAGGGGPPIGAPGAPAGGGGSGAIDPQLRLHPDEGSLAITPPTDAKAGAEVTAKITLTPTADYHVNEDFPIKLILDDAPNVTFAKKELKAGGSAKQGDADALDARQLAFSVKLTPTQSGNYTINGTFKFAVCTATQCLPKKEPIAIQIAAK